LSYAHFLNLSINYIYYITVPKKFNPLYLSGERGKCHTAAIRP